MERHRKLDYLLAKRAVLEEQASIAEKMDSARKFYERESCCIAVRYVYFSVDDLTLRKRLIAVQRKIDELRWHRSRREILEIEQAMATANSQASREPWPLAAEILASTVSFGYWLYDIAGALWGAVGGYLLARGVIETAQNKANAKLATVMKEREQLWRSTGLNAGWTECFTLKEEQTGQREKFLGSLAHRTCDSELTKKS